MLKIKERQRVTISLISNGFKLTCGIAQSGQRIANGLKVLGSNHSGDEIPHTGIRRVLFWGQKSDQDAALTKLTHLVPISN